jgi:hypothetical protein
MMKMNLENQLDSLINIIDEFKREQSTIDTIDKLAKLKGKENQKTKKTIVTNELQIQLYELLQKNAHEFQWDKECNQKELSNRDSIDIFGKHSNDENSIVIIEIDAHRADQVAKKFISRQALYFDKNIIYISLCYFGTSSMSRNECNKYFNYCRDLTKKVLNVGDYKKFYHASFLFDEIKPEWKLSGTK